MQRTTPSDDRERVAQSSFLERADTELALSEAHQPQSRINVIDSAVHGIRGAFDLMATETADDWAAISARMGAVPQALADYRATLLHEADHGHVSPRRQMLEAAGQIRAWTGRSGSAGDVFAQQVAQASRRTGHARVRPREARGRGERGVRRVRDVPGAGAGPARTRQGGGRPRAVRPRLPLLPRHRDRPRRDLRVGLGGAAPHRDRDARDLGDARRCRRHDRRRGGRHRERPGAAHRRRGALPRVDAGARRPDPRRHGRHPLRHPRAGPADRVPDRADPGRRHLLHAALGGLHAGRGGCGGRSPTASRRSTRGAR